jgi:hypothetical protein
MDSLQINYNTECNTQSLEPLRVWTRHLPHFWETGTSEYSLSQDAQSCYFLNRCKDQVIIHKLLFLQSPLNSHRSSEIIQRASKTHLRDRLRFQPYREASLTQQSLEVETFIRKSVNLRDQQRIFTAVSTSFNKAFHKQKDIHIHKCNTLN